MKYRLHSRSASRQRGVVLLFSLIALIVLLIAAVALMRSFNTSMFMAGNIAFKRDLQNQGERAVEKALNEFRSGLLATNTARSNDLQQANYRAVMLTPNAQGIPPELVLDDNTFFATVGDRANEIDETTEPLLANTGVKIRYVIDRMSTSTGSCSSLGAGACIMANFKSPPGGSASNLQNPTRTLVPSSGSGVAPVSTGSAVYRLTVRVTGPRDTQAFFQSTFTP